jgi:PTH1 family peptidyl-tRNA hydrolase
MGYLVVNRMIDELKTKGSRIVCQSVVTEAKLSDHTLLFAKPLTFMNRSGTAVKQLLRRYGAGLEDLIVIHDDVDLERETVRIKSGGGHGGHKGIRSIIDHLSSPEFIRVRVGIGRPPDDMDTSDYVLTRIDNDLSTRVDRIIDTGARAVQTVLLQGPIPAMNRFNRRNNTGNN